MRTRWSSKSFFFARQILTKAPLDQVAMKEIAIVGGGFAGLTLAAGLIKKRVNLPEYAKHTIDTAKPIFTISRCLDICLADGLECESEALNRRTHCAAS